MLGSLLMSNSLWQTCRILFHLRQCVLQFKLFHVLLAEWSRVFKLKRRSCKSAVLLADSQACWLVRHSAHVLKLFDLLLFTVVCLPDASDALDEAFRRWLLLRFCEVFSVSNSRCKGALLSLAPLSLTDYFLDALPSALFPDLCAALRRQ